MNAVKQARIRAGISQTELGRRIGLDQSGVSRIEHDSRALTVERLLAIAEALGVDPSELIQSNRAA